MVNEYISDDKNSISLFDGFNNVVIIIDLYLIVLGNDYL